MERKYFYLKNLNTVNEGVFEGYASTFDNLDLDNDIITRTAFQRSLEESGNKVVLLYQHQHDEPIGVVHLEEDNIGLFARGELNLQVQKAKEVHSLLKQGALDSMSIGFQARDYYIGDDGVRYLKDVELLEVSVVTFPANPEARMLSIKSPSDISDIESSLNTLNHELKEMINE